MLLKHGRCLHHGISRANRAPLLASLLRSQQHCRSSLTTRSRAAAVEHTADSSSSSSPTSSSSLEEEQEFPEMQLVLPPPSNAQVRTAEFVKSSVEVKQCPPPKYPEFAVIGRSNVGKSSLINLLTNRKSLAMVSKQPGKTRCINHFVINNSWYLVDLPGYGYARTGKEARRDFDSFTRAYFKQRSTLVMVLLLVDCSIPPQGMDLEYAGWLGQQGLPFSIVFTKADKKKKGQQKHELNIAAFKQALLEQQKFSLVPPCLVTSASSGAGKQEVLNFVASLRVMYEQAQKKQRAPKQQKKPLVDEEDVAACASDLYSDQMAVAPTKRHSV